jgi:hypothetical protein
MCGRQHWAVTFRERRHTAELVRLVVRTPLPAGSPLRWAWGGLPGLSMRCGQALYVGPLVGSEPGPGTGGGVLRDPGGLGRGG